MEPEPVTRFTHLLIEDIVTAASSDGPKEQVAPTPFRHSGAGKPSRQLAFRALGRQETEPMDEGGRWVTWIGTVIHEKWQQALLARYPDAKIEVPSVVNGADGRPLSSGSADAVIGKTLYELKTMGGFGYDKSIGRSGYKAKEPEGPRRTALMQASINALANECDEMVIGHMALEAVSIGAAEALGIGSRMRILAEWSFPRPMWEPWAATEIGRLSEIRASVEAGIIPVCTVEGDDGKVVALDPRGVKVNWNCTYCAYRSSCSLFGPREFDLKDAF